MKNKKPKFDEKEWEKKRPSVKGFVGAKDLKELRKEVAGWHSAGMEKLKDPDFWPCEDCHGQGKIYDPDEPIDPVEGRKFAKRIPCPKCDGTGNEGREKFARKFNEKMKEFKAEVAEYERHTAFLKRLYRTLTDEQEDALSKYFGRY